eukprot:COSAG06_NODE_32840_length_499_cov_1.022500_1_plen_35_part_10
MLCSGTVRTRTLSAAPQVVYRAIVVYGAIFWPSAS